MVRSGMGAVGRFTVRIWTFASILWIVMLSASAIGDFQWELAIGDLHPRSASDFDVTRIDFNQHDFLFSRQYAAEHWEHQASAVYEWVGVEVVSQVFNEGELASLAVQVDCIHVTAFLLVPLTMVGLASMWMPSHSGDGWNARCLGHLVQQLAATLIVGSVCCLLMLAAVSHYQKLKIAMLKADPSGDEDMGDDLIIEVNPAKLDLSGIRNRRYPIAGVDGNWNVSVASWAYWPTLASIPVAALILATLRRRGVKEGVCPRCGYDLRASPNACPECGFTVSKQSK